MMSLAASTFAFCWLRLFVLPHTTLLVWGDQLEYATKGVRVLGGELPYRDFFEFLTPGTDLVYALIFRCVGLALWVPNLVMCVLASIATLWMTWCAHRLVRGWFVVLPAALNVGFVLYSGADATHHWFSTVASMGAVCALFGGNSLRRVAVAGASCGVAASFTQTKGGLVTAALIAYFIWIALQEKDRSGQWWRRCLVLCAAALVAFAAINGPLILAAGWEKWAWDVIVFPVRYASSVSADNWTGVLPAFYANASKLKWVIFPVQFIGVPLTYLWFFLRLRRAKAEPQEPWNQLALVAVVGVAMLAAVATMPSIKRLSAASPPAVVLITWLLSRGGKVRTAVLLGAASAAIAAAQFALIQLQPERIVDLPAGRAAIPPKANYYELFRWAAENTKPGQWYYGLHTLMFPLELRNPTPIEDLGTDEFSRPKQVAEVVEGLENKKVPMMILLPRMYILGTLAHKADHLQPFRDYLYSHYRETETLDGGYEVWERVDK